MGYQVYYSYFQPVIGFVEHKEKGGEVSFFPPFFLSFFFLSLFRMMAPGDVGEEVYLEALVSQMRNPSRPAVRLAGLSPSATLWWLRLKINPT